MNPWYSQRHGLEEGRERGGRREKETSYTVRQQTAIFTDVVNRNIKILSIYNYCVIIVTKFSIHNYAISQKKKQKQT